MLAEVFWGQPLKLYDSDGRSPSEVWLTQTAPVARALWILGDLSLVRNMQGRSDGGPMRQPLPFRVTLKPSPLTPEKGDTDFTVEDPDELVEIAEEALQIALRMGVVSEVLEAPPERQ